MQYGSGEPVATVRANRLWPAHLNAALWGLGAGMVSSTLVVYLANALGATGLLVSLILAAPQFVGLGRVAAIRFTRQSAVRKRLCIAAYAASAMVLVALPALAMVAQRAVLADAWPALCGVVAVWCVYHLCEYVGTVALWAWFKAIVPASRLGSFIGRRNLCLEVGRSVGMIAGGLAAWRFERVEDLRVPVYSALALAGAVTLLAAAAALAPLPAKPSGGCDDLPDDRRDDLPDAPTLTPDEAARPFWWREALTPLLDPRVARVLAYGCWFSTFNGFTQSAQNLFPARVLGLGLIYVLVMRIGMTWGQALASPAIGKIVDRYGNRGVLVVSQFIVGLGLAGYLLASEERWWLIAGAWLAWIAYAGINISVPDLLLRLAPPGRAGACVAGYFALTGVCFAVSVLAGGYAFDFLQGQTIRVMNWDLNRYQYLFYLGVVTRVLGCGLALRIREPRAVDTVASS